MNVKTGRKGNSFFSLQDLSRPTKVYKWCSLWSRSCAISGRRKIRVFFERTWYFVVISMLVEGFCRAFQKVWTDILWKGCQLLPPCCGGVWHHQKSAPFSGPNFLWDRFWNFLLVANFLCDRFRYIFVYQIIFETDPKTFLILNFSETGLKSSCGKVARPGFKPGSDTFSVIFSSNTLKTKKPRGNWKSGKSRDWKVRLWSP